MDLKCECLYCGHVFLKHVYYMVNDVKELNIRCERRGCNDRNIRVWPFKNRDVFGYDWKPAEKKNGKPDLY